MTGRIKKILMTSVALLLAAAVFSGAVPYGVSATSDTRKKIEQTENEIDAIQDRIEDNEETVNDLKGTKSSLQDELGELNRQLTQIGEELSDLEEQIRVKEAEIDDTELALEAARVRQEEQYESMKLRIRYMYESNDRSYLEALLTSDSFGELLDVADYFERITAYDRNMLDEYEANCNYIEAEEERLKGEREELEDLRKQALGEQERVSSLVDQTSESIAMYSSQISSAEQQALEYEAQLKQKEEDLEYLQEQLAKEIAMSQKAANGTWRDISEVTFADGDRKLLANLIYCEAGGEPYEGQVAVGSVVINRVLSSVYPNTVVGVIYQSGQFSPVASGRLDLALAGDLATASCYRAADEAMSGVSNVGNCVYFRTPVPGLTGISIGGHIFY